MISTVEEVDKGGDGIISDLPQKCEGKLLIIGGYPAVEENGICGNGMSFSVSYCLCFMEERTLDTLKESSWEERDTNLYMNKDIRILYDREITGRICQRTMLRKNGRFMRRGGRLKKREGIFDNDVVFGGGSKFEKG